MNLVVAAIILAPLLGFIVNGSFRTKLSANISGIIGSTSVFVSFALTCLLFFTDFQGIVNYFDWIRVGDLQLAFEFQIDSLSTTMMLIITGVGFLIHVYSIGYMHHDDRVSSFFAQMNLFIFFMLLLVMGGNYLILFIGWEGVGLCSYLLIGFWFKNNEFNYAARKAFIMNRIGDLGFLLGIILLFYTFGSLSFANIFPKLQGFESGNSTITLITILLLIGAFGKSAQIPLYTWLPDAMAGPTPVSALIHAATMVTAGIYMIARSGALYMLAPVTLNIILVVGSFTAIFAATIGLFQNDIKKVLAYSTVSQLGYMFIALGLGAFSTAIFHVTTHAFFKALLFMAAGSVIHALHNEQDINKMGGLKRFLPITYITFFIGTLAIAGIPPFSGFFSKDEILLKAFEHNWILWIIGFIGAGITCFYMFRMFYKVFISQPQFYSKTKKLTAIHESPKVMTIPLMILAFLSLFGGFINIPSLFGGNNAFANFLSTSVQTSISESTVSHSLEFILIGITLAVMAILIFITYRIYVKKNELPEAEEDMKFVKKLIFKKYYIDELYNKIFVNPFTKLSEKILVWIEAKVIDGIIEGVGKLVLWSGSAMKHLQKGSISYYLFFMVVGIMFLLMLNVYLM